MARNILDKDELISRLESMLQRHKKHGDVIDFEFYTGKQFPKQYQGGAFFALHGSSNRSKRVGYSVAFIPFEKGKPSGPIEEFLTGWMLSPDKPEVWGRPTGLLQMPDGSLPASVACTASATPRRVR